MRYELTLTQMDGVEREVTASDDLEALLELRDLLSVERRKLYGRNFCYRVLDSNDYERGQMEWEHLEDVA